MSRYLIIEGVFHSLKINGKTWNIPIQSECYIKQKRFWYKPWTWFMKNEIVQPESVKIGFAVNELGKPTFITVNDFGSMLCSEEPLLLTNDELNKLRKAGRTI